MKRRWFANNDLPINILCRLPAKTLHCLKFVSKDWQGLISNRSFVASQSKKTEPVSGFFFQEIFRWFKKEGDMDSISYIPVEGENVNVWHSVFNFLPEIVIILSLNNGLLCCRSCFPSTWPRIHVCNPLNKEWTSLEWPNIPQDSSIALVFDPFKNPIDKSTNFKLVAVSRIKNDAYISRIRNGAYEYCLFFDIYSSETGLWRRSKECCECNDNFVKNKGVLVEGVLYWLTDGCQILMYDPQNELPWLVKAPLPATQFNSIPEMCIGESQGNLCYVIISEDGLQLWILEDHFASQWELKISISLDELEKENPKVLYRISEKVWGRLSKCELPWIDLLAFEDGKLLLRVSINVYLYQFDVRMMKKLCNVSALGAKCVFSPIVVPYTMSLVPLS